MFVEMFKPLLPFSLGFAAGCMVWIVFAELLPDAMADSSDPKHVATTVTLSAGALEVFRMVMEGVERYGEAAGAAQHVAAGDASSAMDVGLAAAVYAPVGTLALMRVFPSMVSLSDLGASTSMGIAASMAGMSAAFRLLWAIWRGIAGGTAFIFVVLGGLVSVFGGILTMRWTSTFPSLRDMRPWSDIDDDDAQEVDIEGRVLTRRFGNVFFTQEAILALLAAGAFATADGAHATAAVISNSWYSLLPALMRAFIRVCPLVLIASSTDRRPHVIGGVALVGLIFVSSSMFLGVNHSSSGTCIFYDTLAAVGTLIFVYALKPLIVFAMMTKGGEMTAGVSLGVAVTIIFAVSSWAFCAGTMYCDISSA
jgi:hypothetical protein